MPTRIQIFHQQGNSCSLLDIGKSHTQRQEALLAAKLPPTTGPKIMENTSARSCEQNSKRLENI
jgi:hypothetical protein